MNLMFRKNFREGGPPKSSTGGGLKNKNAARYQAKRSRDMNMGGDDDVHFRTHIFFAASRGGVGSPMSMEGYKSHFFLYIMFLFYYTLLS